MNKGETFETQTLTRDEISDLLELIRNPDARNVQDWQVKRDLAAFILMYRAGLRRKEVSDLELRDIDYDAGVIHVRHGKGDKERRVSMDEKAFGYLREWQKHRGNGPGVFLQTSKGTRVHESNWNRMMGSLAERSNIGKRCNPHSLRHTMANEMRQEGVSTYLIMKQLGHANIQTTERYLDHLSPVELVDTMKGREW